MLENEWGDRMMQAPAALPTRNVVVHGHHLAFHILPGRLPALVLDAGGGADSSYWSRVKNFNRLVENG